MFEIVIMILTLINNSVGDDEDEFYVWSITSRKYYAPTKDNPTKQANFAHKLSDVVYRYDDCRIIIGGNLNICQNEFYDM